MRYLIGDIGGTNTRLAVHDGDAWLEQAVWPSSGGLDVPLDAMNRRQGPFDAACLAVAGPVFGGRTHLTNLGWDLAADALSAQLGCPVRLINDFHAQALAMTRMGPADRVALPATRPADRPAGTCIAVLGPGTGLGEAILALDSADRWIAIPGEGSHKRFAPQNEQQITILRALQAQFGPHVSVERIVSGPGLVTIYDHLRRAAPSPAATRDAAEITAEALRTDGCAICTEAVEILVDVLADEAGALALQCNAGAVWIGGGIAPRILPILQRRFRTAFAAKGRYQAWLETVPVFVCTHPDPGLLGALIASGG